jgi:hypothetical protein
VEHLAHIMFVQVLRAYLVTTISPAPGWLGALTDQRIGQAIRLMHQDPARRWSAGCAGQRHWREALA